MLFAFIQNEFVGSLCLELFVPKQNEMWCTYKKLMVLKCMVCRQAHRLAAARVWHLWLRRKQKATVFRRNIWSQHLVRKNTSCSIHVLQNITQKYTTFVALKIQGGPIKTAHFLDTIFLQPLQI